MRFAILFGLLCVGSAIEKHNPRRKEEPKEVRDFMCWTLLAMLAMDAIELMIKF